MRAEAFNVRIFRILITILINMKIISLYQMRLFFTFVKAIELGKGKRPSAYHI